MVIINMEFVLMLCFLWDMWCMNMFVLVVVVVVGLLFGFDIGVIVGVLLFIIDYFVLISCLQEWVVSSMMFGVVIGVLFNGWLLFCLGCKYSLMVGVILFVFGFIGFVFVISVEMLIVVCVVLGIVVGIVFYIVFLYFFEMVSENVCGKMISMYQLMVIFGIVLVFLFDIVFSYSGNWCVMLGVFVLLVVLLIILVVFLLNSLCWLVEKGCYIEVEEVLCMLCDMLEKV